MQQHKAYALLTGLFFLLGLSLGQAQRYPLRLWFDTPARQWEETLPLGNGRLGMMPDGGVFRETIVLNDITLWSGGPQDANNYEAHKSLPKIRSLLLEGKNDEAQSLINRDFVATGKGSGHGNGAKVPFGCYQVLGNLHLTYHYKKGDTATSRPTQYRRELSLDQALSTCTYTLDGVTYTREYITSFDNDVALVRITSHTKGALSCDIAIDRPERFRVYREGDRLSMSGQLDNGTDGNGMRYLTQLKGINRDGTLEVSDDKIIVRHATELILFVSAGTDFRNPDFEQQTRLRLDEANRKPYAVQRSNHLLAYQKLFNRVSFRLGTTHRDDLPTDARLLEFQRQPEADLGLNTLFFQFGRYLSISSTRVGLLPPNLQGLWANQIQTPWNGDYHLDVNVQMNHWPVEVTNLSELNLPLVDLVTDLVKPGEKTARAYYQADGWVAHVITNIWGFTEPGEDASWGITNAGSGWLCNNLWDHYAFTNDKNYLRQIYPVLKGAAMFYASVLIKDPKTGWQVTAPSVSPENTFILPNGKRATICMGPTIDNQIVRELFTNLITASEELNVDSEFRKKVQTLLNDIPPVGQIAKDGRLMEWLEEYRETEPTHRHVSHLYGLYPASLITPAGTPALAQAARKTLDVRGDDSPGWSKAYKILFWTRLKDGNRAYKLLKDFLSLTRKTFMNNGAGGGVYPNLLCAGPPFQIDGNFGGTAGIAEMLIQSHEGYIELLPAVPDGWKGEGAVKGLKARGNFTVDFSWKNGRIISYRVTSPTARPVKISVNGRVHNELSKVAR
ncbi:glycoside hydrolase family 95 protein [Spirosoma lacussanchae]|uniref:glycoside hydrolase family 95 protein n=1 Tax=Spirosoma lacussanchae TaxID=1884249 RepID=UPI001108FCF9|nr:glycoside hydrolase family 95 protein [Spirosoma lacussanchae]